MTYGSTFTGIGGFDLGFDEAGMQCLWQVEQDKDCNRVLRRHWPKGVNRGQRVEEVTRERFARPDVICGGFPCQDLSVAGRRKGLAGSRSGLFWEFHRIVDLFKPCGFVLENVPGLFSSNEGRDFLAVLGGLEKLGYCLAWTMLDSQYFGVPQRRDRVFVVGSLGNGSCAEILFEPESVRGDSPPSREKRESVARDVALCLNSGRDGYNDGSDQTYIAARMTAFGEYVDDGTASTLKERDFKDATDLVAFTCKDHGQDADEIAPTLRAMPHDETWSNGQPDTIAPALSGADAGATSDMRPCVQSGTSVRRLTPRECERLQGFPDDWTRWDDQGNEISDSARYRMLGNAVTVTVAKWLGQQIVRFA